MLQIGSVVGGKYKILNKAGQGGMSVVYLAINEKANKQWAVKEVRKDGIQDYEVVRQRLIAETDMLKKLRHDNLPSIIDVIDDEGAFLIVMDYIEGNPLSKTLQESGAQTQENVIRWAKQLCDVLGYLHAQDPPIIYRDMKPSNVMLKPEGKVMLIDFGTAREFKGSRVEDTTCLGTRGYAAPEQYGGMGETDARTDIYCLGATMYHLVTGHNPSEPPYQMYPVRKWDPNLSSGLEEIILKCTRENPDERYQSCAELMYDLEHYSELDIEYKKRQNWRWAGFLAAAALTVSAAAGAAGFWMMENRAKKNSYDQYIADAKSGIDKEEQIEAYEKAIRLKPEKGEAYIGLLENGFLDDSVFDASEEKELRRALGASPGQNITNETYLKKNDAAYEEFALHAAMAYYYFYEDSGNKTGAKKWLDVAADASALDRKKIKRCKMLRTICGYYHKIGVRNKAGDAQIGYRDYWNDLAELTKGDLASMDVPKTAIVMYSEMVTQIINRSGEFLAAGVTEQEMKAHLDHMERRLDTDFTEEDNVVEAGSEKGSIDKLRDNIRTARSMLTAGRPSDAASAEGERK